MIVKYNVRNKRNKKDKRMMGIVKIVRNVMRKILKNIQVRYVTNAVLKGLF